MATAGRPPRAKPVSARKISSEVQSPASATPSEASEAATRENAIIRLRPTVSDSAPASSSEGAITSVEIDNAKLAAAGDSAKSRENSGSSGCTL